MFDPHKRVASGQRSSYTARPTVIAFVAIGGVGGESLLMVLPQKADPQGWILPQGEILLQESPYQAAMRILDNEFGLKPAQFQTSFAVALDEALIESRSPSDPPKHHFVIALKMISWVPPRSSDKTKFFLAGGPNAAWEHFANCRQEKQALFVSALGVAVGHRNVHGQAAPILNGPRWKNERLVPVFQNVLLA